MEVLEVKFSRILKNTKYAFQGKFDAILVNFPAFNPQDDIIYR